MKLFIFALAVFLTSQTSPAFADIITITQPDDRTLTTYAGCETNYLALVPLDAENSVLYVTCDELSERRTLNYLDVARNYTPFSSVVIAFGGKEDERGLCNLLSMWREDSNQIQYFFQCFKES